MYQQMLFVMVVMCLCSMTRSCAGNRGSGTRRSHGAGAGAGAIRSKEQLAAETVIVESGERTRQSEAKSILVEDRNIWLGSRLPVRTKN